ncbi:MAG: alpha-L-fucosidase [Phycisphaerae bacterium]|jgi:alpha-L-fucosidase
MKSRSAAQTRHKHRLEWWQDARFGLFLTWGLYSVIGRHEWAMVCEAIPMSEYELLAQRFKPDPNAARQWAKVAKQAGMKYMVMTAKHHEGFCLWDTQTTDYCAPRQACGRDLVAEYVQAARAEGLGVGIYYSLMDWHHPDGQKCAKDLAARKRYISYVHQQVRELCANYGKIDILWYDCALPLKSAAAWQTKKMNAMVRRLQPDILIDDRAHLPGDFKTHEQGIHYGFGGGPWETCMTLNDSWAYQAADDAWKSPKRIIRDLLACARGNGNYLLAVGPQADGMLPEEAVKILTTVGKWLAVNGAAVYGTDPCPLGNSVFSLPTRKGNKLYLNCYHWPGRQWSLPGWKFKVKSAHILATGQPLRFQQDRYRVRFMDCPKKPPQPLVTTIVLDCDRPPVRQMTREQVWTANERPSVDVTFH